MVRGCESRHEGWRQARRKLRGNAGAIHGLMVDGEGDQQQTLSRGSLTRRLREGFERGPKPDICDRGVRLLFVFAERWKAARDDVGAFGAEVVPCFGPGAVSLDDRFPADRFQVFLTF